MATSLDNPNGSPVSMASRSVGAGPYLLQEYEKKCSPKINAELNAVTKSMYEKGLGRKISHSAMIATEESIEESINHNDNNNEPKDLAAVHLERAMAAGIVNNEGRRWRRKLNTGVSRSQKLRTEQLKAESMKYGF